MARREFSAVCGRHLLVMHGKVGMKGDNLPGGTLLGSMLMSDRGAAGGAGAAGAGHGMRPRSLARPRSRIRPRRGGARALAGRAAGPGAAGAHVGGGHVGALVRAHGTGRVLVARSPGGLRDPGRVSDQSECRGQERGYLPVGQPGDTGLRPVGRGALALWASGTEIGLPGRAGESAMRLVCARLIDTVSGEVAAQFFGLTNLPASQADAGTVARWLVLQDEPRPVSATWPMPGRPCRRRWRPCAGAPGLDGRPLAAACWQLAHSPAAEVVRALVGRGGRGSRQADRAAAGGAPEDVRDAGDGRRRLRRAVGNEAGKRKGASLPAFSRRRWACGSGVRRGPGRRSRCWPARRPVRSSVQRLLGIAQVHVDQGAIAQIDFIGGLRLAQQGLPYARQLRVLRGGLLGAGMACGQADLGQQGIARLAQFHQFVGDAALALGDVMQRVDVSRTHQHLGFSLQDGGELGDQCVFLLHAGLQGFDGAHDVRMADVKREAISAGRGRWRSGCRRCGLCRSSAVRRDGGANGGHAFDVDVIRSSCSASSLRDAELSAICELGAAAGNGAACAAADSGRRRRRRPKWAGWWSS